MARLLAQLALRYGVAGEVAALLRSVPGTAQQPAAPGEAEAMEDAPPSGGGGGALEDFTYFS